MDRYRRACYAADKAAKQQLKQLATKLIEKHAIPLSAAARFNQALIGAEAHVGHCEIKGWVVPEVSQPLQYGNARKGNSSSSSGGSNGGRNSGSSGISNYVGTLSGVNGAGGVHIQIEGMYPYWMDSADLHTVRTDVDLSSMMVLTGPNMAGKAGGRRVVVKGSGGPDGGDPDGVKGVVGAWSFKGRGVWGTGGMRRMGVGGNLQTEEFGEMGWTGKDEGETRPSRMVGEE